jgi:hypothetical protein
MENRNSRKASRRTQFGIVFAGGLPPRWINGFAGSARGGRVNTEAPERRRLRGFGLACWLAGAALLAGCGAPGDPVAPSPPVPTAITDLSAHQAGDGVQLTFTLPSKTIRGERLAELPAVEILRGAARPDRTPDPSSFREVETIPGALIGKDQVDDHVQLISPIASEETRAHPGAAIVYRVRTRASKKRASLDSNAVTVHVFPVPQRIATVDAKVTETSIDLSWPPVSHTSGGDPIAVAQYHIYRGELDPRTHDPATKDVLREKWNAPPALLASPEAPTYRDTQFDFDKTYVYIVRSVTAASGNPLESSDSEPLLLTPKDTFPPATPREVVAAVLVNPEGGAREVDLSWSINTEPDLAGYRVYRGEKESDQGSLVTPDLLLSPAYRDTTVVPGHTYWYRVTAVDRSGNESIPAPPVAADVAQQSP